MATDEQLNSDKGLAHRANSASTRAADLRQRTIKTAKDIVQTEEEVARTFDQMAEDFPHRAPRLKKLSQAAREHAASEKDWIAEHQEY